MTVHTINKENFELLEENTGVIGTLSYSSNTLNTAIINTGEIFSLQCISAGLWHTCTPKRNQAREVSVIRVEPGSIISIKLAAEKKKYFFKKSAGWKLRFSLSNKEGEDLLTLVTNVNWQKESHDFILQVNEEYEKECSPFLILQALHCANCSLSMMNGGKVPALVSI